MKPIEDGTPSADMVDHVESEIAAMQFQDKPLYVYAKNYRSTLTVLSNALKVQASPSAPDGEDDLVKAKLKTARTDHDDAARYCSE